VISGAVRGWAGSKSLITVGWVQHLTGRVGVWSGREKL